MQKRIQGQRTPEQKTGEKRTYRFIVNGGRDNGFVRATQTLKSRLKDQEARDAQFTGWINGMLEVAFADCYAEEVEDKNEL